MRIPAISGYGGLPSSYRVSSVHGNPHSLNPIGKIGEEGAQKNKALVIATEEKSDDLYVKDFGEQSNTTKLESGAFAEFLKLSEASSQTSGEVLNAGSTVAFYNDTIGMMGYSNMMRNQLTGSGFSPFVEA